MRKGAALALLFFVLTAQAAAAEPSLFFTPAQSQMIEQSVRARAPEQNAASKNLLHLSSILYFAPDRWSIWLQGRRFGPDTREKGITIRQVTPEGVTLDYEKLSGGAPRTITLRPHQSVNLLTDEIIEGY